MKINWHVRHLIFLTSLCIICLPRNLCVFAFQETYVFLCFFFVFLLISYNILCIPVLQFSVSAFQLFLATAFLRLLINFHTCHETAFNGFEYQFTTGKPLKNLKLTLKYFENGSMCMCVLRSFENSSMCVCVYIYMLSLSAMIHVHIQKQYQSPSKLILDFSFFLLFCPRYNATGHWVSVHVYFKNNKSIIKGEHDPGVINVFIRCSHVRTGHMEVQRDRAVLCLSSLCQWILSSVYANLGKPIPEAWS